MEPISDHVKYVIPMEVLKNESIQKSQALVKLMGVRQERNCVDA